MNLGTDQDPKNIYVYDGLSLEEFTTWHMFFKANKSTYTWTYKDLKRILPDICEHQIILEDNIKPIR